MALVVKKDMPAFAALKKEQIDVITPEEAQTNSRRSKKIAIVNLMPKKEETEFQLLKMLSQGRSDIEAQWICMQSHRSRNTSQEHLDRFYTSLSSAKQNSFDALIVTGAPIEKLDFEEVDYWDELKEVFAFSDRVPTTLFLCWASQAALYHYYKIPKYERCEKLFGIYKYEVQAKNLLTKDFGNHFFIPQSRYTMNKKEDLEKIPELEIIASDSRGGANISATKDGRKIFIAGHFEYDTETLFQEYRRDQQAGLNTAPPENYFKNEVIHKDEIINRWDFYGKLFFANWLDHFVDAFSTNPDQTQKEEWHQKNLYP